MESYLFAQTQFDCEINFLLFQTVLRQELRATAVGADARQLIVQTEHGGTAGFEFIIMSLASKLLLCIAGRIEGESLTDSFQTTAIQICDRQMRTTKMAAVFLRAQIILMLFCNGSFILAKQGSPMFIAIAFKRTIAKIFYRFKSTGQEHPQTETRQERELFSALSVDVRTDSSVRKNSPYGMEREAGLEIDGGKAKIGCGHYTVFRLLRFRNNS